MFFFLELVRGIFFTTYDMTLLAGGEIAGRNRSTSDASYAKAQFRECKAVRRQQSFIHQGRHETVILNFRAFTYNL